MTILVTIHFAMFHFGCANLLSGRERSRCPTCLFGHAHVTFDCLHLTREMSVEPLATSHALDLLYGSALSPICKASLVWDLPT